MTMRDNYNYDDLLIVIDQEKHTTAETFKGKSISFKGEVPNIDMVVKGYAPFAITCCAVSASAFTGSVKLIPMEGFEDETATDGIRWEAIDPEFLMYPNRNKQAIALYDDELKDPNAVVRVGLMHPPKLLRVDAEISGDTIAADFVGILQIKRSIMHANNTSTL